MFIHIFFLSITITVSFKYNLGNMANFSSLSVSSLNSLTAFSTPPGYPEFVHPLNASYKCSLCGKVLHDAMQLACGHLLCLVPCFEDYFQDSEYIVCKFDDCGEEISRTEVFPDAFKRREILKLLVYCTNKPNGCVLQVKWKDLSTHEENCDFRRVACPLVHKGCTRLVLFKDKERHRRNSCGFEPENCTYCSERVLRCQLKDHIVKFCPFAKLDCPNGCDVHQVTRKELEEHLEKCPKKPRTCSFSCIGCTVTGSNEVVTAHEENAIKDHIALVNQFATKMEERNLEITTELNMTKTENGTIRSLISQLQNEYRQLEKELAETKKQLNDLKILVATQREKLIKSEGRLENCSPKSVLERMATDIAALKELLTQTATKVTGLQRNDSGNELLNSLQASVRNLEQQHSLHEVRMAELDLRFQILETANYDGQLMWKIKDFKRRFNNAKEGKTLSLFSQPFYTSKHGYKMCARMYPFGDGIGKGRYLSFFFVIMRGEFDNLLTWPFTKRVSLIILDQDTRNQNIVDTFAPDRSSNSFRKPVSEMNVASGVPCFIDHNRLFNEVTYLQNDTIFLKILVQD